MEKEREGRLSYEMKIKRGSERRYTVYHVHALTSMIRLCIHCPTPACFLKLEKASVEKPAGAGY